MIVTDKLLFLHLHKSAGTFVNAMLLHCLPSARRIGYHLPYREAPEAFRDLPVLGTVRNPFAYYVSWYHFQSSQPKPNILFLVSSDDRKLGFKGTIANLVGLYADERRMAQVAEGLPDRFQNHGINLTKNCVGELGERGVGFYSFLYERLYAGTQSPTIMRVENIRSELRSALDALGHLPNTCVDEFLSGTPPLNVSSHEEPSHYFDDELAALVAECDSPVIDRYGYSLC